jgi:hypothetical protein
MNRPVYGAFGERELDQELPALPRRQLRAAMIDIFRTNSRSESAGAHCGGARHLSVGDAGPRCFTVMTAASGKSRSGDPRHGAGGIYELDKAFAACFRLAKEKGELLIRRSGGAGARRLDHPHYRDPRLHFAREI